MEGADPDEAVVMLNLLKYREVAEDGVGVNGMSGRDAYTMYRPGIRSTSSPFRGRSDMDGARPAQCDRSGGVGISSEDGAWKFVSDVSSAPGIPMRPRFFRAGTPNSQFSNSCRATFGG